MSLKSYIQGLYYPERKEDGDNRDYFFDNLKAYLILLVVIGHFISELRGGRIHEISRFYYFIHTFHMPCFAFASGYMAKGIMKNGKFRADRYFSILWLYFLFQAARVVLARLYGHTMAFDLFDVTSAPWYLLALSMWYLLVPVLQSMRPAQGIILTGLGSLLIGYVENVSTYLALSRMIVFLPFFAIGLYLSRETLERFLNKKWRLAALLLLAVAFGYFVFVNNPLGSARKLVMGGRPYSYNLGELAPYGFLIRGGLQLFAVLISAATMLLIPRRRMWFSYVGRYSLTVYILHILVWNLLKYEGAYAWIKTMPEQYRLLAFPFCIVLTLVLGNPFFGKIANWISNPFCSLKRKKEGRENAV